MAQAWTGPSHHEGVLLCSEAGYPANRSPGFLLNFWSLMLARWKLGREEAAELRAAS